MFIQFWREFIKSAEVGKATTRNTVEYSAVLRQLRGIWRGGQDLTIREVRAIDVKFLLGRVHEDGKYDFLR